MGMSKKNVVRHQDGKRKVQGITSVCGIRKSPFALEKNSCRINSKTFNIKRGKRKLPYREGGKTVCTRWMGHEKNDVEMGVT